MLKSIKLLYKKVFLKLNYDIHKAMILNAQNIIQANNSKADIKNLAAVEFQVFSQNGEDGIIQYLLSKIEIPNPIFIEFGVETYIESNTRFLLQNNNWSGLVIEADGDYVNFIKKDSVYQKYDLEIAQSFITTKNINNLITNYTNSSDIGLLSIDIDGNDYWIWKAITTIQPRIVICEYNATFGASQKVTIPYDESFSKRKAHFSDLYFGASLNAICDLANEKGYDFIGTNKAGVNAFFVRKDISKPFKTLNSHDGFNELKAKSSRDKNGKLTYKRFSERLKIIENQSVLNLENNSITRIKELYNL